MLTPWCTEYCPRNSPSAEQWVNLSSIRAPKLGKFPERKSGRCIRRALFHRIRKHIIAPFLLDKLEPFVKVYKNDHLFLSAGTEMLHNHEEEGAFYLGIWMSIISSRSLVVKECPPPSRSWKESLVRWGREGGRSVVFSFLAGEDVVIRFLCVLGCFSVDYSIRRVGLFWWKWKSVCSRVGLFEVKILVGGSRKVSWYSRIWAQEKSSCLADKGTDVFHLFGPFCWADEFD